HPMTGPPKAKPSMARVNGSDASARAMAKSACTVGSATGNDHMPTPPIVASATAALSRTHDAVESIADRWAEIAVTLAGSPLFEPPAPGTTTVPTRPRQRKEVSIVDATDAPA